MSKASPLTGGGADVRNLWPTIARQIQQVAVRYGVSITLVGSRAAGTSNRASDFDYVIIASHRVRNSAKHYLPRGPRVSEGGGIDIFSEPLDVTRPHIVFFPETEGPQALGGEV